MAVDTGPIPTENQFPCRTLVACLVATHFPFCARAGHANVSISHVTHVAPRARAPRATRLLRFVAWLQSFRRECVHAVTTGDRIVPQEHHVYRAGRQALPHLNPFAFGGPHNSEYIPEWVVLQDLLELHRAVARTVRRCAGPVAEGEEGGGGPDGEEWEGEEAGKEGEQGAAEGPARGGEGQGEPSVAAAPESPSSEDAVGGSAGGGSGAKTAEDGEADAGDVGAPAAGGESAPKKERKGDREAELLQAICAHLRAKGCVAGGAGDKGLSQKELYAAVGAAGGLTNKKFANLLAKHVRSAKNATGALLLDKVWPDP